MLPFVPIGDSVKAQASKEQRLHLDEKTFRWMQHKSGVTLVVAAHRRSMHGNSIALFQLVRLAQEDRRLSQAGSWQREGIMKFKLNCGLVIGFILAVSITWADSLELRNGSLIEGKFLGGTKSQITFQVGSSVQTYNLADITALKFDSETAASDMPTRPASSLSSELCGLWRGSAVFFPVFLVLICLSRPLGS